jgi:heme oxygenase
MSDSHVRGAVLSIPPVKSIRESLRAATAEVHELDASTRRLNLGNPSDYGGFLLAQSGPLQALETALEDFGVANLLADWSLRSRRTALLHDLTHLGLRVQHCTPLRLKSPAQAFGVLYVLEGSRLGARFLLKQVLTAAPPFKDATEFLRHGEGIRLWPSFLIALENGVASGNLDI